MVEFNNTEKVLLAVVAVLLIVILFYWGYANSLEKKLANIEIDKKVERLADKKVKEKKEKVTYEH